jgi:hypothetical protein
MQAPLEMNDYIPNGTDAAAGAQGAPELAFQRV